MLLPVPENMYPWVMMIFIALLLAPVEFASPRSHSGRYHRVAPQTRDYRSTARGGHDPHATRAKTLHRL
jgi:hypothetical protein